MRDNHYICAVNYKLCDYIYASAFNSIENFATIAIPISVAATFSIVLYFKNIHSVSIHLDIEACFD